MRCPIKVGNEAEVLVAYTTGTMTPAEQEAFELHMAECAGCRELAGAQKSVWGALDLWKLPPVSDEFDRKLHARIAEEARLPWWKRQWSTLSHLGFWFSWKPAIPVGVACAALVGAFVLHGPAMHPAMHNVAPGAAPAAVRSQQDAQKMDVDEVERALDDMDMLKQLDAPASAPARAPQGS